MIISNILWNC